MKAIGRNVLIKIQVSNKEKYNLAEGVDINIVRGFEFNRRIDYPSYGVIIDAKNIPAGAECLVHHNSTESNYIVPHGNDYLTPEEIADGFKVFSIDVDMCFIYRVDEGEWQPCEEYLITSRLFKKYEGKMVGIEPEVVKNRMLVLNGVDKFDGEETDLSGLVVCTLVNCDYEIIYHNKKHKEERIIRTRHREIEAIDYGLTEAVKKGKYLVGLSPTDCKALN